MLSVACYHFPRKAYTIGRRQAWHVIIALGQQTQSVDVGRGISTWAFGSTNGQMTSCIACHHGHWATDVVR